MYFVLEVYFIIALSFWSNSAIYCENRTHFHFIVLHKSQNHALPASDKKEDVVNSDTSEFIKEQKELWLYKLFINVFLCI